LSKLFATGVDGTTLQDATLGGVATAGSELATPASSFEHSQIPVAAFLVSWGFSFMQ
jgi:hypothetical protein